MYFDSFSAFLQMGTHGVYVWSAYGISILLVAGNLWLAYRGERKVREDLRRFARREQSGQ